MPRPICLLCSTILFTATLVRAETPPDQAEAVTALRGIASNIQKNRDGTVRFVRFSKPIVANEHVAKIAVFKQLDYLAVVTANVTDDGLQVIAELSNLDSLFLSGSGATDRTLQLAAQLPKLERLYLDDLAITDKGLSALSDSQSLTTLSLNGTKISDRGLASLAKLNHLDTLSLQGCNVSATGLESLRSLQALRVLRLGGSRVAASDLAILASLPNLETIELSGLQKVRSEDLAALKDSAKLKTLLLYGLPLTPAEQQTLQQAAPPKVTVAFSPPESKKQNALQRFLTGGELAGAGSKTTETPSADLKPITAFDKARANPDFQKHVVPLFGRLGCNGRTCHGSFQGQGDFQLSMFGFDFAADHEELTGGDEPRVDRDNPAQSLIANKPTSEDEHGGGRRFAPGGWEQQLLIDWIANGAKGVSEPARIDRLVVEPAEIVFTKTDQSVQLKCIAIWESGEREDVTKLTRFQSNDEAMTTVTADGLVTSHTAGDTHIVAFYDNAVTPIPIILPVSDSSGENYPPHDSKTEIDKHILAKLSKLGVIPSERCTDSEFLRRVSLDLVGTLPSEQEVRDFLADSAPDKRATKVDELLKSPAYAQWWSVILADLTGSNAQFLGSTDMNQPAAGQWNQWLRRRIENNAGWDEIAAGIILATSRRPGQSYDDYVWEQSSYLKRNGTADFSAPANPMHYYWFRSNNQQPADRALSFGYVFLGVRLQCAQCHKHPFDQWSKQDFDDFTQFFTRIRAGAAPDALEDQRQLKTKLGVPKKLDTAALRRQMYMRVAAEGLPIPWNEIFIQKPGETPQWAKVLGGVKADLNQFDDPREPLVAWLVSQSNPYFARAFVNRIWAHYFGVGIVDPPDDLNLANPPSNKPLLDYLANQFAERGFDIRWLHREILASDAYQRSFRANKTNRNDRRNFSRALLRRMPAEVTIDAILRATAASRPADEYLARVDARKIGQHPKSIQARGIDYSLLVFGKPLRTTNCDCERQAQPTLLQSLFVRNDTELIGWLERADGWLLETARQLGQPLASESGQAIPKIKTNDQPPPEETISKLVESAYYRTLSRPPSPGELTTGVEHLKRAESHVEGLRDLMWALLNSREFITNH